MRRFLAPKIIELPRQTFGGMTPVAGAFLPPGTAMAAIRIVRRGQQQQQAQSPRRVLFSGRRRQAG